MPTLLLELFSEEIPARMQQQPPKVLLDNVLSKCVEAGLARNADELNPELFVTPRRIGIKLHNLPAQQPDVTIEKKGPKVGAPEKAIEGFLRGANLKLEDLEKRTVGKDEVYFSVVQQKGRPTAELLKGLIEEAICELVWPKSMRWGDTDVRWVRPLHSICCLLDDTVIPVQFGPVTASNTTRGHRFLAPDVITLNQPDAYERTLKDAFVIADWNDRRAEIAKQTNALAEKHGLVLRSDDALLDEVAGLVEWPVALMGRIEDRFMALPHELLQVTMRYHQKYFTLEDADGNIAPHFIFIANRTTNDDGKQIIAGNGRVLRARFSDAEFFFAQDQKKPLTEWAKGLEKVTFHAKLGTVADKVKRITSLVNTLANELCGEHDAEELVVAASLCKADLVTGMVGEFPELQGIIGSYYARSEGRSELICTAIYDLYKHEPEELISSRVSHILCMADRLDTLVSLFSIDEKPSGSKDPYGLRRAALTVISIIRNYDFRIKLRKVFPENQEHDLLTFFDDRVGSSLYREGIERTTLKAIGGLLKDDDIIRVEAKARALQAFLGTDESTSMLAAYKRAANILAAEEKKAKTTYKAIDLDAGLLKEAQEQALHQSLSNLSSDIAPLMKAEKFTEVMQQFARLKEPLDTFFEDIMVNSEDAVLRANRLRLLAAIIDTMHQVADFGEIAK